MNETFRDENREEQIKEIIDKIGALPINELEMGTRAKHCLFRARIRTVGEFVQMSEQDICDLRQAGEKTKKEIADALQKVLSGSGLKPAQENISIDNVENAEEKEQLEERQRLIV